MVSLQPLVGADGPCRLYGTIQRLHAQMSAEARHQDLLVSCDKDDAAQSASAADTSHLGFRHGCSQWC